MSKYERPCHALNLLGRSDPMGASLVSIAPGVWRARRGPDPSRADLTPSVHVGADPMHGAERVCTEVCELRCMARQPRQDYLGATHHVFVRGVARSAIAVDETDYEHALTLLERAVSRFEFQCHAWCYLPNHSHLLLTSRLGNLSRAMHWLGMCTAQSFNRRHERSGHLYQGRFGSRLVEDDAYLLELGRYLPRNPVRAGLCDRPEAWAWSSYAATAGLAEVPRFLEAGALLETLGSADGYVAWVAEGVFATYLDDQGIPRRPERPPLETLLTDDSDRAIASAHFRHGYTKAAIARHLGVSRSQISRRLSLHA
jgi:putative transposase